MSLPDRHAPADPSRRIMLGASLLATPLAFAACASGVPGGHPPPLPAGLVEGEQRPLLLNDPAPSASGARPYPRMLMSIPAGYAASTRPWPLLVFLHGAGERGLDIEDVKRCGPPMLASKGIYYPMVVCSPQTDVDTRWQPERLHALLAALSERFAIDRERVIATGLSLGGSGTWRWACAMPDDLAAAVPICGATDPTTVSSMVRVPVRAYHGDKDEWAPIERQQACVDELRRAGGTASFTIYKGVGHDSWTPAYVDPELVPWMLKQRRA